MEEYALENDQAYRADNQRRYGYLATIVGLSEAVSGIDNILNRDISNGIVKLGVYALSIYISDKFFTKANIIASAAEQ